MDIGNFVHMIMIQVFFVMILFVYFQLPACIFLMSVCYVKGLWRWRAGCTLILLIWLDEVYLYFSVHSLHNFTRSFFLAYSVWSFRLLLPATMINHMTRMFAINVQLFLQWKRVGRYVANIYIGILKQLFFLITSIIQSDYQLIYWSDYQYDYSHVCLYLTIWSVFVLSILSTIYMVLLHYVDSITTTYALKFIWLWQMGE
jgi:hypothetical protein